MRKLRFQASLLVLLLLMISLLTGGCMNREPVTSKKPAPADTVDNRLVAANTGFGFKLFQELNRQDPEQNIFISPASIAMVLAMTYNGADGETKKAMAETLELKGLSPEDVNRANADLRTILENPDPGVSLTTANSLWARKGFDFKPEFMQINKDYYGAEVKSMDFTAPGAPAAINRWVSQNTNGRIDKIIDRIDRDDILFLINTLYFKGKWTDEFDPMQTREGLFTLTDGTQKKHPMMSRTSEYGYYQGNNFQSVRIPYGNKRVSMYVFLPNQDSCLDEFYQNLTIENVKKWMSEFQEKRVSLVLPRFQFEYEVELNNVLKNLGMEMAFDANRANFGKMCSIPPNIYIGKVKHKTFVEVNEHGTEAAAATSVEIKCGGIPEVLHMVVDRPFFFMIRDEQTETILFMGSVTEPQA